MSKQQDVMIAVDGLEKTFTLHLRDGLVLPVLNNLSFDVRRGECLVLTGPSGAGKSSLLSCIYGNYLPQAGDIKVRDTDGLGDLSGAAPGRVLALRRTTLGYVSQFLRVVPRVATLDLVMEPLLELGHDADVVREKAATLLERLRIPEHL